MLPHAPPSESPSRSPAGSARASRPHKPARTPADTVSSVSASSRAAAPHAAASSVAHTAAVHIPAPVHHPSLAASAGLAISGRTGNQTTSTSASAATTAASPLSLSSARASAVSHAAVASSPRVAPSLQAQHQQRPHAGAASFSATPDPLSESASTPYLNQEVLLMNREGSKPELRGSSDADAASDTDSLADEQLSFNRLPREIVPAAAVDAAMRYIADGSRRASQQQQLFQGRHKPKHSEASNSDDSDEEGGGAGAGQSTFLTGLPSASRDSSFFGKIEPFGAPAVQTPAAASPAAAAPAAVAECDSEELANQALHHAETMEREEQQRTKAAAATPTVLRPSIVVTEPLASPRSAAPPTKQAPAQRAPSMVSGAGAAPVGSPRTRRKASETPAVLAAAAAAAAASASAAAPSPAPAAAAAAAPNPNLTIPSRWFELTSFGSGYVSGSRLRRQIADLATRSEACIKDLLAEEGPALITPEIIAHEWFSAHARPAAASAAAATSAGSATASAAAIIAEAAAASAAEAESSSTAGSEARARTRTILALKDLKALDARIGFVPDSADSSATQATKRAEQIELVSVLENLEATREALRDLDASGAVKFMIDPPSAEEPKQKKKQAAATSSTGNLLPSSLSKASLASSTSAASASTAAAADATGVPLQMQGDLNFYTLHHLLDREALKYSREVCVAVREWWHAAEKITVSAPPATVSASASASSGLPMASRGVTLVPKREYERLMRLLYFVLVDCDIFDAPKGSDSASAAAAAQPKSQKEADERAVAVERKKAEFAAVIQRDWIVDSAGGGAVKSPAQEGLNFAQFHRSLFQLADHWVPSLSAASYALFLRTLLNILTEAEEDEFGTIHRSWKQAPFSFDLGPALGLYHRKLYVAEEASPDWLADLTDWPSDDEAELGALLAPEVEQIESALAEEARLFPALEDVTRALKLAGVADLNVNSFYSADSLGSGFSSRSSGGPLSARSSTGAFSSPQSLVKITASQAADSGIGSLSTDGIVRDVGGNVIGRQSRANPAQILDVDDDSIVVGTVALHREEIEKELAKAALTNKENALTAKMVAKEQAAAATAAATAAQAAQAAQAQAQAAAAGTGPAVDASATAAGQVPNSPASSNALPSTAPVLAPSGSSRSIAARAQELIFATTLSPAEAHRAAMAAAIRRKLPKGLLGALRDAGLIGAGRHSLLPPPSVSFASVPVAPGSTPALPDAVGGAASLSAEDAQAAAAASAAQASEARSILGDVSSKAQAAEIIAGRTKVVRATNGQMILIKLQSGTLLNSLTNLKSKASAAVTLRKKMASNLPAARSGEILRKNATFKKRMAELVRDTANLNERNTDRNVVVEPRSSDDDDEDDDDSEGGGRRKNKKRLGALLSKHVLSGGAAGAAAAGESAYLASQKALKAKLDAAELEKQEAANARVAAEAEAVRQKEQAAADKLAAERAKQERLDEIIRKLTNSVRNLDSEPTKEIARLAAQKKAQEEEAKMQDKQDRAAERRRSIQANKSASGSPATGRSRAGSMSLNVDVSTATVTGLDDDSALARAMKAALAVRDSPARKPVNAARSSRHSRQPSQDTAGGRQQRHGGHTPASDDLDRLRPHGVAHRRNRSALAPGESESITDPVTGAVLTRRRKLSAAPPRLKPQASLSSSPSKGTLSSSPSASALVTPSGRNDDDDDSEHEYADESTGGGWVTSKGGAASAFKSLSRRLAPEAASAAGGKQYLDHSARGYHAPIQQGHWSKAGGDRFKEMYRFIADSDYVRVPPSKSRPASPGTVSSSPIRRGLRHQPSVSGGGGYGDDEGGSPAAGGLSKSNSTPVINADAAALLGSAPVLSEEAYETQVEKLTRLRRERHALEAVRREREKAWAAKLALIRKRKAAVERGESFEPTPEERELERALLSTKRGGGAIKHRSLLRHVNGGSSTTSLKAGSVGGGGGGSGASTNAAASPKTEPESSDANTPTDQSLDAEEAAAAGADSVAEEEDLMDELPPQAETAEELALREEEESVKALLVTHLKREEAREKLANYLSREEAKAQELREQERRWNQPAAAADGRSKTPPSRPSRILSRVHSRSQSQTVSRVVSRAASRTSSRASSRRGSVTHRSRGPSPSAETALAAALNNEGAVPDVETPRVVVADAEGDQPSSRSSSPPPAVTFADSVDSGPAASTSASAAAAASASASASDKFKARMKHTPLYVPREKRTFKPVSRKDRDEILNRYDEDEEKRKRAEARKLAQIKLLKQTAAGAAVVQKKLGTQGAVPLAGALGLVDPSEEKSLLLPSKKLTLNPADLLAGAAKLTSSPRKSIFGNRTLVGHVAALQVAADAANKAEAEARRTALAGGGGEGSPLAPSPLVLSARGSIIASSQMIHSGIPVFANGGWIMPAADSGAPVGVNIPLLKGEKLATPALLTKSASQDDIRVMQKSSSMDELGDSGAGLIGGAMALRGGKRKFAPRHSVFAAPKQSAKINIPGRKAAVAALAAAAAASAEKELAAAGTADATAKDKSALSLPAAGSHRHSFSTPFANLLKEATASVAAAAMAKEAASQQQQQQPVPDGPPLSLGPHVVTISISPPSSFEVAATPTDDLPSDAQQAAMSLMLGGDMSLDAKGTAMTVQKRVTRATELSRSRRASGNVLVAPVSPVLSGIGPKVDSRRNSSRRASREVPKDAATQEAAPAPIIKVSAADKPTDTVRRAKSTRKSGATKGAAMAATLDAAAQPQAQAADDDDDRQFDLSRSNSDVSDAAASESDSDEDDSPSKPKGNAEPVEDPWAATPVPDSEPTSVSVSAVVPELSLEMATPVLAVTVEQVDSVPVAVAASVDAPASAPVDYASPVEESPVAESLPTSSLAVASDEEVLSSQAAELAKDREEEAERAVLIAQAVAELDRTKQRQQEQLAAAQAQQDAAALAVETENLVAAAAAENAARLAAALVEADRAAAEAAEVAALADKNEREAKARAAEERQRRAREDAATKQAEFIKQHQEAQAALVAKQAALAAAVPAPTSTAAAVKSASISSSARASPIIVVQDADSSDSSDSSDSDSSEDEVTASPPALAAVVLSPATAAAAASHVRSASAVTTPTNATEISPWPTSTSQHGTRSGSPHSPAAVSTDHTRPPSGGSSHSTSAHSLLKKGHKASASAVPLRGHGAAAASSFVPFVPVKSFMSQPPPSAAHVPKHKSKHATTGTAAAVVHRQRRRSQDAHTSEKLATRLESPPVVLVTPVLRYITPTQHQSHPNINIVITPDVRASDQAEVVDEQGSNNGMFDLALSQVAPVPPFPEEAFTSMAQPELPPSVTPDEIGGTAAGFKQDPIPKGAFGSASTNSRSPASTTGSGNESVIPKTNTADSSPQLSASPPTSSIAHVSAAAPAGDFTAAGSLRGFHSDHSAENAIFAGQIDDKEDDTAKATAAAAVAAAAVAAAAEREVLEAKSNAASIAVASPMIDQGADSSSLSTASRTSNKTDSPVFEAQPSKSIESFGLVGANRTSLQIAGGSLSAMIEQAGATINQTAAPASDPVRNPAATEEARHQASTKALHKGIAKALGGTVVAADGTLQHTSSTGSLHSSSHSKLRLAKGNVISKRGSTGHHSSASFQASYAHVAAMELTGAALDASEESQASASRSHTRHSSQASIAEEELSSAADQIRRAINDAANAEISAEESTAADAALEGSPQPTAAESAAVASSAVAPSKPSSVRQPSSVFNASANAAAVAAAAAAQPKQAPATALDLIPPQRPGAGLSWPLSRDRINRNRGALKDMGASTDSKPLVDRAASGLSLSKVEAALQQVVNSVPLSVPAGMRAASAAQAELASREVAVKEDLSFAFRARLVGGPHIQRNRGLRPARVLTTLKTEQYNDEEDSPLESPAIDPASSRSLSSFLHIGHDGEKSSRAVGKQPVASSKLRRPVHAVEEKQDGPSAPASGSLADLLHSEPLNTDHQRQGSDADAHPSGSDSDEALSPSSRVVARGRSRDASTGFKPSTAESRARPASLSPLRSNKGQSASTRVPFGALRSQLLSGEIVLDETPAAAAARRRHAASEKARRARERKSNAAAGRTAEEKDAEAVSAWAAHEHAAHPPGVSSISEDAAFSSDDASSPVSTKKRVPRSRRRDYSIHSRMQVSLAGSLVDSRAEDEEKRTAQKSWVDATAQRTEELAALSSQHHAAQATASVSSPSASPTLASAVPAEHHLSAYAPALHLSLAGSYLAPALLVQSLKSRPTPSWTRLADDAAPSDAVTVAETIGHLHEKKLLEAAGKLPAIVAAAAAAAAAAHSSHEPERANTPLSRLIAKGEVASAAALTSQQQPHSQPAGAQSARADQPKRSTQPAPPQQPQPPHSARGAADFARPAASAASPFSSYHPSPPLRASHAFAQAPPVAGMAPLLPSPPATPAISAASHLSFTQQAVALLSPSAGSTYARPAGGRRPPAAAPAAAAFSSARVGFASGGHAARPVSPVDLTPRFTFQLPKKAAQIR